MEMTKQPIKQGTKCPDCKGRGVVLLGEEDMECILCDGTGKVKQEKTYCNRHQCYHKVFPKYKSCIKQESSEDKCDHKFEGKRRGNIHQCLKCGKWFELMNFDTPPLNPEPIFDWIVERNNGIRWITDKRTGEVIVDGLTKEQAFKIVDAHNKKIHDKVMR